MYKIVNINIKLLLKNVWLAYPNIYMYSLYPVFKGILNLEI